MEVLSYVVVVLLILVLGYFAKNRKRVVYRRKPEKPFPEKWRQILQHRVPFYQKLKPHEKKRLEDQVHYFLVNVQIVGAKTEVTDLDRILIAAGASIPTFRFEKWHYVNLNKVVVYPERFEIPETDQMASGLVGWGAMEGQVWLSRKALYKGFHDTTDNKNVAIHEFIHLIDMQDGFGDGVIDKVMEEDEQVEWLALMQDKKQEIDVGSSSIRPYAAENPVEFLAAVGEFYFENPGQLRSEHPKLYRALDKMFNPTGFNF